MPKNKWTQASARWLSAGFCQCQSMPQAVPELRPASAISRLLRAGRLIGPVFFLGAEPIAIRALARCDNDVYSLYLRGHAAEARWLALRSVTVNFGDALFRHFDQVAHE